MAKNHGFTVSDMPNIDHLGEISTDGDGYKIGEGFLTGQSGGAPFRVKYTDLYPCQKNAGMSKPQEKIEALADSIAREGLLAPLVVVQRDNGKYEILSGETRYLAIGLLRDRGVWDSDDMVDARLFDADQLDLPLSREMKEDYARRTANIARDKTTGDYRLEISEWRDMIKELRANGIESLSLPSADGKDHGIQIAGVTVRDIIAKIVGLSPAQVQKYFGVEEYGTGEIQDALLNGNMSVDVAARAAKILSKKDQKRFAKEAAKKKAETGKRATQKDLDDFIERVLGKNPDAKKTDSDVAPEAEPEPEPNIAPEPEPEPDVTPEPEPESDTTPEPEPERMEYTKDAFYGDMRFLCDCFDNEPNLPITVREHERVLECISTIQEILSPYLGS